MRSPAACNHALRWALDNYEAEGIRRGEALSKIAERLVEMALGGNLQAIIEIANRLDGNPAQAVDLQKEGGGVTVVFKDAVATRPAYYKRQQGAAPDLD